MNRLYQIKGYKEVDGYIHPITELCKDSDELVHIFLTIKWDNALTSFVYKDLNETEGLLTINN